MSNTIADNLVVEIHYTLTDDNGNVIDTSEGREPLPYLHGNQNIVPGLEKELTGKSVGDKLKVNISPDQGYGHRDENMIQDVPKDQFDNADQIQVGQQFQVETDNGQMLVVSVAEIKDATITLDGNHPLAGVILNFDVEVVSIRPATEEEISHGHAHSGDGHQH